MAIEGRKARISGCGSYLPETVITNDDLSRMVDTSDDWIVPRTGIRERRVVRVGEEASSDLGLAAARGALEMAGTSPAELDLVIAATITPDHIFPNAACLIQQKLGAERAGAFDLAAACSGFIYALDVAKQFVAAGSCEKVLVVGVDCMSMLTNWEDRNSCIIFGDGAGAVVVEPSRGAGDGEIFRSRLGAKGESEHFLVKAGGSRYPVTQDAIAAGDQYLRMEGRKVFRFAVDKMQELLEEAIRTNGFRMSDIRWVVPHQVNRRIIESAFKKLDIPLERVVMNIDRVGNTSAASVPTALDEAVRDGRIQRGDLCAMVAFGAGLAWASTIVRW